MPTDGHQNAQVPTRCQDGSLHRRHGGKVEEKNDHLGDLAEVFTILKQHLLRLNAAKCAFRFSSGKFLGHLVTRKGNEENPTQVEAVQNRKVQNVLRIFKS